MLFLVRGEARVHSVDNVVPCRMLCWVIIVVLETAGDRMHTRSIGC
jgi:hypothetical protein